MSIKTLLLAFLLATFGAVQAQIHRPVNLRLDLVPALQGAVGGGLEWQYTKRAAISLFVNWNSYNKSNPYGVFQGDLTAEYAEWLIDTIGGYYVTQTHNQHKVYLGNGRPLDKVPNYISTSSLNIRLGRKFLMSNVSKKWRWSLTPSISMVRHRFIKVSQKVALVEELYQASPLYGSYPNQWLVRKKYSAYEETRTMRKQEKWLPGLAYDIGLERQLGRRWTLEARLNGLYNLQLAYKGDKPAQTRAIQVRGQLFVGYMLGKIKQKEVVLEPAG